MPTSGIMLRGAGRFMPADPYKASAGASEPGSWNRFSHVEGDPINFVDPQGLQKCSPSDDFCMDIPPPPPVPTSPLPGLPPLTGPGYIPALPPGPPGPGPYSAPTWMGFNQSDGNVVRNAQNMASNWVKNKNCDHALQGFGVKSLGDALDAVHVGGKDQNVWNGRNSQLPITFQENGVNWVNYTLPVAEYFSKHSKSVGAIVFSSPQWVDRCFWVRPSLTLHQWGSSKDIHSKHKPCSFCTKLCICLGMGTITLVAVRS